MHKMTSNILKHFLNLFIILIISFSTAHSSQIVMGIRFEQLVVYDYWFRGDKLEHKLVLFNASDTRMIVELYYENIIFEKRRYISTYKELAFNSSLEKREMKILDYPKHSYVKSSNNGKIDFMLSYYANGMNYGSLPYASGRPPYEIPKGVIASNCTRIGVGYQDVWYELNNLIAKENSIIKIKIRAQHVKNMYSYLITNNRILKFPVKTDSLIINPIKVANLHQLKNKIISFLPSDLIVQIPWSHKNKRNKHPYEFIDIELMLEIPVVSENSVYRVRCYNIYEEMGSGQYGSIPIFVFKDSN